MSRATGAGAAGSVLDRDEVESVLSGKFYSPGAVGSRRAASAPAGSPERPGHYKVICISMYTGDLERLDGMVEELKSRGLTKASRSALIRFALSEVDLDKVPRGL